MPHESGLFEGVEIAPAVSGAFSDSISLEGNARSMLHAYVYLNLGKLGT